MYICSLVNYKNILIIQTAFIGDAILASSLIEKFHVELPDAKISLLVRQGNETLYSGHPFLESVLVWDKKENKTSNLFKLLFRIRERKFDCIINCHRYASSGFLTAFSGAKHTAGYKQTPFSFLFNTTVKHQIGNGKHETERYTELVSDFISTKVFKPKLYPSASDLKRITQFDNKPYSCIFPASVWFTKQLPAMKWIELVNSLPKQERIYILGSKADWEESEKIKNASTHNNVINLCGELSLLESAALMRDAVMNYVNDSAPLHLASALNAPVTAFFCSTIPEFGFGPLSENSSIKEVKGLTCRPCGLHGHRECPKKHFKCGNEMVVS